MEVPHTAHSSRICSYFLPGAVGGNHRRVEPKAPYPWVDICTYWSPCDGDLLVPSSGDTQ